MDMADQIKILQEKITETQMRSHLMEKEILRLKREKKEVLETLKLTLRSDAIPVQHYKKGQEVLYKYLGYIHPMHNQLSHEELCALRGGQ